jgi:serpin B
VLLCFSVAQVAREGMIAPHHQLGMKTKLQIIAATAIFFSVQTILAADADLPKLAAANNAFSFKLIKQLASENAGKNVFVSPYSAATALQLAANGAGGQTLTEMKEVLGTTNLSPAELGAASKAVSDLLNAKNKNVILTTANSLWYRQGVELKKDFADENQKYFKAAIQPLDFKNASAAEAVINEWASNQTHGRITGIADGMINSTTDLILANAIYFKGKWEEEFEKKLTKERTFHPSSGPTKQLPMMEKDKTFTYGEGSGYQVVRLPYKDRNLAMYMFLPANSSSPVKLLENLDGEKWRNVMMRGLGEREGFVAFPKFELENTFELVKPLQALGMKSAFTDQADFSGMFGYPHKISDVRQKAFVEVSEEGTEAAAVTAVGMRPQAIRMDQPRPFEMIVDRPFFFTIVDARSEMILFMGVVNDL